jgi:hypothetical protein
MIPLAWRFLRFQKDSALARWYQARTADRRTGTRKTHIGRFSADADNPNQPSNLALDVAAPRHKSSITDVVAQLKNSSKRRDHSSGIPALCRPTK